MIKFCAVGQAFLCVQMNLFLLFFFAKSNTIIFTNENQHLAVNSTTQSNYIYTIYLYIKSRTREHDTIYPLHWENYIWLGQNIFGCSSVNKNLLPQTN